MAGTLPILQTEGEMEPNPNSQELRSKDESPALAAVTTAVYSNVGVWEVILNHESVMRRRDDSFVNATHILKLAGFDKSQRTKILENVAATGRHDKVQGGYGKFQGTWVPLERAIQLAEECGVFGNIRNILTPDAAQLPDSAPAPKATSASKANKAGRVNGGRRGLHAAIANGPNGFGPAGHLYPDCSQAVNQSSVRQSTASLIANYRQKNASYTPQSGDNYSQARRHSIAASGKDMVYHRPRAVGKPGRGRKSASMVAAAAAAHQGATESQPNYSLASYAPPSHPYRRSSMPSCNEFDHISSKSLKSLEMDPLLKAMIDKVYDDGRESEDIEGADDGTGMVAPGWGDFFGTNVEMNNSLAFGTNLPLAPASYYSDAVVSMVPGTTSLDHRPSSHSSSYRFGMENEDFTTEMDESYFNFGQYSLSPSPIPDASHSTAGGTRHPASYPLPSADAEHDFLGYLLDPAMELNRSILTALFLRDGSSAGSSSTGSPTPEEASPTSSLTAGQLRLRHGANLNSPIDDDGNTVLHWAVTLGRVDTVKFLRDKKARVDVANSAGETALIRAAYHSACHEHMAFADMLQILAEKSLLLCDRKGRNLLHHICGIREPYHPSMQALKYYLQTTLDFIHTAHIPRYMKLLHQVDEHGDTPLIVAARAGVAYFVKLLLEAGADPYHRNHAGLCVSDFHLSEALQGIIDKMPKPKKGAGRPTIRDDFSAPLKAASAAQEFASGKLLAPIAASPDRITKILADGKVSQAVAESVQPYIEKANETSAKALLEKNEMDLLRQKLFDLQRQRESLDSRGDIENIPVVKKRKMEELLNPRGDNLIHESPISTNGENVLLQVSVPGPVSSTN